METKTVYMVGKYTYKRIKYEITTKLYSIKVLRETEKAFLMEFDYGNSWVPKSHVIIDEDAMVMTQWIFSKLELGLSLKNRITAFNRENKS